MVIGLHTKGQNVPREGTLEEIRPWVLMMGDTSWAEHNKGDITERWVSEFETVYLEYPQYKLVPEEIEQVLNGVPLEGPEGLLTLRKTYCCYWYNLKYPEWGCAPDCECKGCDWCEESFPPEPCNCTPACDTTI